MLLIADLDGTFYPATGSLTSALRSRTRSWLAQALHLDAAAVAHLYGALPDRHPNPLLGFASLGLSVEEYHAAVFDRIDPAAHVAPDPAVRAALRAFGNAVHVVTFASQTYARRLLTALGVRDCVSSVRTPSSAGWKEKGDAYAAILKEERCTPADVTVIGDRWETDLLPARHLGCAVALVDESSGSLPGGHELVGQDEAASVKDLTSCGGDCLVVRPTLAACLAGLAGL